MTLSTNSFQFNLLESYISLKGRPFSWPGDATNDIDKVPLVLNGRLLAKFDFRRSEKLLSKNLPK